FDFTTFQPFNTGRARSRGLEAEAGWSHGPVSARWNATWLSTEDRDSGKDLLRRPQRAGNLLVTWRPRAWTLLAAARYLGSPFAVGAVRLESYNVAGIAAAYRLPHAGGLEPYARIENL